MAPHEVFIGGWVSNPAVRAWSWVCAVLLATAALVGGTPAGAEAGELGPPSRFRALNPTRLLDTRVGLGAAKAIVAPGKSVELQVAGRGDVPPDGANAVVLNVTITQATRAGHVQVYPADMATLGSSSNLNVEYSGQTISNLVTSPLSATGTVTLFTYGGGHLVADVLGFYEPSGPVADGRFVGLSPARLLDTRNGTGVTPPLYPGDSKNCSDFTTWAAANTWFWTYYPYYGDVAGLDGDDDQIPCETLSGAPSSPAPVSRPKVAARSTTTLDVAGRGGVPGEATAVVLNITATQTSGAGFVQVVPSGTNFVPGASSNVNVSKSNQTIAGLAVVPLSSSGTVELYTYMSTHLLADVTGYYTSANESASSEGLFVPVSPSRLVDTRSGVKPSSGSSVVVVAAGRAGIPASGVAAVALNVTATQSTAAGHVEIYPTGIASPGKASTLNVERANQTIANAALAALGDGGATSAYVYRSTHVIADVSGYFTGSTTSAVHPELTGLVVAPQNTSADYDRDSWNHWIDADGDCQSTRHEVLIRQSTTTPGFSVDGCVVLSGSWIDPYTGSTWSSPTDVQIDHLVALANAHRSGGWAWTPEQKEAFANDLDSAELRAVEGAVNTAKADSGPETWKPPSPAAWCGYATDWAGVKHKYALTVTAAEYEALQMMLETC